MPEAPLYLVEWLGELGWCASGAMGPVALPAAEVAAWAKGTGRCLQGWEFLALQQASRHYVGQLHNDSPVPPDGEEIQKPSVAGKFKTFAQQLNKTST